MRFLFAILVFVLPFFSMSAQSTPNGTKSEYKDGRYFHTYSTCVVNAPAEEVEAVLTEIYDGLKKEPTKSLRWAFLGLGKSKSKEDNVQLYEKSVIYDPATDIYVVNLIMIMDESNVVEFNIEGKLKNTRQANGKQDLTLNVTKKVKVLNDCSLIITSAPKPDGKTTLTLQSKLKFGFIIDLFFTQNKYREVIEWRLAKFLVNIKERAENNYRQKNILVSVNQQ